MGDFTTFTWQIISCLLFFGLGLTITAILGIVYYENARKNQDEYNTRSICQLLNKTSAETCSTDSDSSRSYSGTLSSRDSCTYEEWFQVNYPTSDGIWFNTTIHVNSGSNRRDVQIGQSYPCFYSRISPTSVIWDRDSEVTGKIMLIVGWTLCIPTFICIECACYVAWRGCH